MKLRPVQYKLAGEGRRSERPMNGKKGIFRRRPRGFTLIELLTCGAIIIILASMILLGMYRVRDYARKAWCASNLHQLGLGMMVYFNDNQGYIPPFYFIAQRGQGNGAHYKIFVKPPFAVTEIGSIGLSTKVMICPSDDAPYALQVVDASGNTVTVPTSYMYNFEPYMIGLKQSSLKQPTDILMFFDGDNSVNLQQGVWWGDDDQSSRNKDSSRFGSELFVPRHLKEGNALFMDGHCIQLKSLTDTNGNFVPGVLILPSF